jgi:hypothetical protein
MNILLVSGRGAFGERVRSQLAKLPNVKVDWFSGVRQQGGDFYLGDDYQFLYPVHSDLSGGEPTQTYLPLYEMAIVIDDGSDLDGELYGFQIAGFLAGRSIYTIAVSDNIEIRRWAVDYGCARTMTSREFLREVHLNALVSKVQEMGLERTGSTGLKGLTLWQPWAWAVANGKDLENRHWTTPYRGLVAFHASAPEFQPRGAYDGACGELRTILDSIGKKDLVIPKYEDLPKGVFFAVGRIVDVQPRIESPWYNPLWSQCFKVTNLQVLPKPVVGPTKALLFDLHAETEKAILDQIKK